LRALYGYMWAHPGKKLLFMGGEFGQWREWTETESLDWHLLKDPQAPLHQGVQNLVRDLNQIYDSEKALWEADGEPAGFEWIDVDNARENIVAFRRRSRDGKRELICICNFSAVTRNSYKLTTPHKAEYRVIVNTDAEAYSGAGDLSLNGSEIDLPPLTTIWLAPQ
jgi:1,4-alpha-glucan branching enzyme